jgi:hypothetical protein
MSRHSAPAFDMIPDVRKVYEQFREAQRTK